MRTKRRIQIDIRKRPKITKSISTLMRKIFNIPTS